VNEVLERRLEFKTGKLLIILPKTGWTPEQVLEKYSPWINRKQATINTAISQTTEATLVRTRTNNQLRMLVRKYAEEAQKDLNTKINRIYFREMKTKWASHSQGSNLTINTLLRFLPEELVSYIIFHEITHNLERKHNANFWAILNRRHPDYKIKERKLLTYWFLTQKQKQPLSKGL
jgi:hypothetical protein